MDISLSSSLAGLAGAQASAQIGTQFGVAVLKQQLDQQKLAGAQLVQMIDQTPRPPASDHLVDLRA
jgi:redox-regulated HSP33 family molecular chaperone